MEKVRFGVIGIGNMGSGHVQNLAAGRIPGAELTAVCDIKPARLEWAKGVCGDAPVSYFEDSHALITSGLADAIIIATPHYYHPIIGIDAFENGLNVLSEKPIGVYTKKVVEFMDAAKKSGKTFGIMYNQRTDHFYQKMREMVKNGELGQLKRCVWIITDWYRTQAYYNSGGWRATWAGEGGGVLMNQCPHNLDLWQWIFGMPSAIYANCEYGKYHDIEVEDDVTAMAKYPNGATGVFITTTGEYPGTNRLEVAGDRGKIVVEGGKITRWRNVQSLAKFRATEQNMWSRPETWT
ncbi:MAG: Gfo/Idh/MocA family oxidoreductase, partial [Clostridia bacterium]|nr:Gfo/Idh/MocA family oxidoreductase [Clostridia bacterium]